jgi:uncharacterized protein (TIGR02598 family)
MKSSAFSQANIRQQSGCDVGAFQARLKRNPRSRFAGFSLVEVVLAIGIISFAFVAVVGVLPVGVQVSRQAINTTIEAQIAQQLTTQALQADYSSLPAMASDSVANPFYFDDQGNAVTASEPGDIPKDAIYAAAFDISTTTALPAGVSTSRLATVKVCILNMKANRTSENYTNNPVASPDSTRLAVLIPDNGR